VRTVYLLRSVAQPDRRHVGSTGDLGRTLEEHREGVWPATADARPWRVVTAVVFTDDARAAAFEKFLGSGAGAAFAERHFW
jgi:predicted GIY-YIG superfamily endonuclease